MRKERPVIGIVMKHFKKDYIRMDTYVRDEVKQAIFDNGGIAIGILNPAIQKIKIANPFTNLLTKEEQEKIVLQISLCDGIILQGGGFSDMYEGFVAWYCYEKNIPCLGICAGMQTMIRGFGGMKAKLSEGSIHKSDEEYVHPIHIVKDSLFYEIVQTDQVMVNSRHEYYGENIKRFTVTATSEDGVPEVIEDRTKRFFVGVQFHPESLYTKDSYMNSIFKYFIQVCSENGKNRNIENYKPS